jgi:phage terminase large subunit GpA-like protein
MGTTLSFQAPFLESILEWKEFIPSKTWFENEIRLLSGKVMGQYDADRMPHVERIFEEIDKLSVTTITLMTASQTSKTTVGVGVIFKYADTEPSDCLIMFPRESELKKMYENKVKKLLDGCNTLLEKIKNTQAEDRKKGKDLLIKVNGIVINILATNNTKSISTKFNYYDEVVEFPIGKLEEAMERAKSFNESGEKFLITSTQHPTKGGEDQINFYFNVSELKLQYWAYCPKCKEHYYPEPETLV